MLDLILSILCSTSVLMTFKLLEKHKIKLFHVIIINYVIASFWGVVSNGQSGFFRESGIWQAPWFPLSIVIGICVTGVTWWIKREFISIGVKNFRNRRGVMF